MKQCLLNAINMNETTLLHACSRCKSEDTSWFLNWVNQWTEQVLLHMCSKQKSEQWVCYNDIRIQFSNEFLICIFYNLSLFTTLITTAKMICIANRVAYTIYLERIEHILYVWKQEDMSWNSFTVEYLKLNLEEDCLNDKNSESAIMTFKVSLLQW